MNGGDVIDCLAVLHTRGGSASFVSRRVIGSVQIKWTNVFHQERRSWLVVYRDDQGRQDWEVHGVGISRPRLGSRG